MGTQDPPILGLFASSHQTEDEWRIMRGRVLWVRPAGVHVSSTPMPLARLRPHLSAREAGRRKGPSAWEGGGPGCIAQRHLCHSPYLLVQF